MQLHTVSRTVRRTTVALALALLLLPLGGSPAGAELQPPPGPVDPATNFPAYYTDTTGLALQPCLDGPPLCLTTLDETLNSGAAGEGFYSAVSATAGGVDLGLDLEMAFAGEGPGQEVVFARSQYAANGGGLVADGVYTVTDPYGSRTCTADGTGSIKNNACRTDQGGAVGGDFTGALAGRIGPFLTWDTLGAPTGGPPAGYIGDGVSEHRVTGSPTGFNSFRVQGPGIASTCVVGLDVLPNCEQTDLFVVSGKIAPGAAAVITPDEWDFGNVASQVTKTFTYHSIGTEDAVVDTVTPSGPFTVDGNCDGEVVAPGEDCTIDVTFTPLAGQSSVGSVEVVDNTLGSPRTIALTGRSQPVASSTPASLDFGDQNIAGGPSATQDITVANTGAIPMNVTSATASNPAFAADSSNCGSAVSAGSSCAVHVSFDPGTGGAASGTVTVTTDGGTSVVPVTGRGVSDGVRPTVLRRTPAAGATAVRPETSVTVLFSEPVTGVRPATLSMVNLSTGRHVRSSINARTARRYVLDPRRALPGGTRFRVMLTGGAVGIGDPSGLSLLSTSWRFRTR